VKLGKKYGGIFAFDYASYQTIVINDMTLMKQCLNDSAFAGRPRFRFFLERTGPGATYCRGIILSEKRHWSEQRRFVLKNLRDFGFGKSSMEGIIHEEISELIESLRKDVGKPINTRGLFQAGKLTDYPLYSVISRFKHFDFLSRAQLPLEDLLRCSNTPERSETQRADGQHCSVT